MKKQVKKEIIYITIILSFVAYGFRLLKMLDNPKVIEWPVAMAKEVEPTPTPEPINVEEWGDLADGWQEVVDEIQYIWGEDFYMGLRIAHCESRFGRNRIHTNTDGSHDISVFQINDKWHLRRGDILNWRENIRIAYEIYEEQGGNPWVCYNLYSDGW